MSESMAAFFDIGSTLGSARVSPPPTRLLGIDVYPHVPAVLDELARRGIRQGIISNTGSESAASMRSHLDAARIRHHFEDELLIFSSVVGLEKNSPAIFHLAADQAGLPASQCLFVGEDSTERAHAMEAGWLVAPHPILALDVADGGVLRFARITVPHDMARDEWRKLLVEHRVVPLRRDGDPARPTLEVIATLRALAALANARFEVYPLGLPGTPSSSDLYLLRDDLAAETGAMVSAGNAELLAEPDGAELLLSASEEGVTVQLPFDRSVEDLHFDGARHGHNLKLSPDLGLLSTFEPTTVAPTDRELTADEQAAIGALTGSRLDGHLARYTGRAPLGDRSGTTIASRHILHPHNRLAVDGLAADLDAIGGRAFDVSLHTFTHNGGTYRNVEAELAGAGDGIVLVTAHLDSTAASSPPYNAAGDPAPGADDDGSGIAAVLAAAEVIVDLAAADPPERTIRFVLFNAEEHGLIGSHAYARDALAAGDDIEAVFQMDMIGYNVAAPASMELHVGYRASPDVENRSVTLARRVEGLVPTVAPALGPIQLYTSSGSARDPAEGRSDHAAFHQRGYAAMAATEDFFAGPGPSAPNAEPNPNYHREADSFVDVAYAAGIARAVTAAAWVSARPSAETQGGTMSMKIATGATTAGSTNWQQYSGGRGVYLDVDTSAAGFGSTPRYFTTIGGLSSHWATTGATSIYLPTAQGFRVYLRWSNGDPLTPAQANNFQWNINWTGIEG